MKTVLVTIVMTIMTIMITDNGADIAMDTVITIMMTVKRIMNIVMRYDHGNNDNN